MAASKPFKSSPDTILTDEFRRCLSEVKKGIDLFITGKAGTGKSILLRLIRERMKRKEVAGF